MSENAFQALGSSSVVGRQLSGGAALKGVDTTRGALSVAAPSVVLPVVLLPALGGLATGVVALAYPEVLYQGFGEVAFRAMLAFLYGPGREM